MEKNDVLKELEDSFMIEYGKLMKLDEKMANENRSFSPQDSISALNLHINQMLERSSRAGRVEMIITFYARALNGSREAIWFNEFSKAFDILLEKYKSKLGGDKE